MLILASRFASQLFACVAFALVAGNPWWLFAQGPNDVDLVSNAVGLRSIQRLVGSNALQDELEIHPVQLAALKEFLASEEVKAAPKRDFTQHLLLESLPVEQVEAFGKIVDIEDSVDGLVERKASTILHPEQAAELRIEYLRGRMGSPIAALEPANIAALGVLENQNDQISSRWVEPMKEIETECTRVRARAIATLLNELPEVSRKKFSHCFGNTYLVPNRAQEGFDVSSVGLFAIDRDSYPLSVLQFQNRELSQDAEREKQRIFDASLAIPNFDTQAEVKKVMLRLASPTQYEQVFEFLHVRELEHDLRCINENSVLRFLEIPLELVEKTRAECDRLQREVDSVRLKLELPLFKKIYGELAPDVREKLKWMYDGVWCDLE